jgi:hypothetical protein
MSGHGGTQNTGAILEWTIAFVFTGYVCSFIIDLLPSVRTRHHVPQGEKLAMERGGGFDGPSEAVSIEEPLTYDSAGPNTTGYYRGQRT